MSLLLPCIFAWSHGAAIRLLATVHPSEIPQLVEYPFLALSPCPVLTLVLLGIDDSTGAPSIRIEASVRRTSIVDAHLEQVLRKPLATAHLKRLSCGDVTAEALACLLKRRRGTEGQILGDGERAVACCCKVRGSRVSIQIRVEIVAEEECTLLITLVVAAPNLPAEEKAFAHCAVLQRLTGTPVAARIHGLGRIASDGNAAHGHGHPSVGHAVPSPRLEGFCRA